MPRHAAVGIDDDLAPGEAAVGDRAAGLERLGVQGYFVQVRVGWLFNRFPFVTPHHQS